MNLSSFLAVTLACLTGHVHCLIAYDCTGHNLSVAAVNLAYVDRCNLSNNEINQTIEEFQLLEVSSVVPISVKTCLVSITRHVTYCGMHSHAVEVPNGYATYVYVLGRDACVSAHSTGRVVLTLSPGSPMVFAGLKPGVVSDSMRLVVGSIDSSYSCEGASYADAFGTWHQVLVNAQIRISLQAYKTEGDLEKNVIHLRSGLKCELSTESCTDVVEGESYWETVSDDACHTQSYHVLYQGETNVTRSSGSSSNDLTHALVSVEQGDVVFSFRLTKRHSLCYLQVYGTDHPRLLLVRKYGSSFNHALRLKDSSSMDLFTYVNSKFVYAESINQKNFKSLYNYVRNQDCQTRYQALMAQLAIAQLSPNEFAFLVGGGQGHAGTLMGEVVMVTKCTPVIVHRRNSDRCYQELPVVYKNSSFFMTPKYHILTSHGTEITCSSIMGPSYRLENAWWAIMGSPVRIPDPETLTPNSPFTWTYINPQQLATAGIYSSQDLDNLRQQIMYGKERDAISNVITRSYMGLSPEGQGGDFGNFLTEEGIEKVGQRIWNKIWMGMTSFGTFSAGVIGIISVIQIIKWMLDTILHLKALHDVYGWSLTMVAAVWDSLTVFILHRAHRRQTKKDVDEESCKSSDNVPLTTDISANTSQKLDVASGSGDSSYKPIYPVLTNSGSVVEKRYI